MVSGSYFQPSTPLNDATALSTWRAMLRDWLAGEAPLVSASDAGQCTWDPVQLRGVPTGGVRIEANRRAEAHHQRWRQDMVTQPRRAEGKLMDCGRHRGQPQSFKAVSQT
jgi:hypothetical protein